MKRAVVDLAGFSKDRLFREISEGVPLIVKNALSLDDTAHRLYRAKEFRGSEIIRGFAEEEAAKVPILIDLVRCPQIPERRVETLKRFYGHVAKRIYAMTCSYPRIASFGELCELIEMECRPYYLDGPNLVDWIVPNSISAEREQTVYVDYVQDITEEAGDYHWRTPSVQPLDPWPYETPDCVRLSLALSKAGANAPDGLAEIANIWSSFEPKPETNREELRNLISLTLDRLAKRVRSASDEHVSRFIISSWSYPLWPLTMKEPSWNTTNIEVLREERRLTLAWLERTNAKRDPRPAIARPKVEALSEAFAEWRKVIDAGIVSVDEEEGHYRTRSAADVAKGFELPSYTHLEGLFRKLTDLERAALLALGWYAREGVADWPRIYEQAIECTPTLDEGYQISYGSYWLAGLDRWEEEPRPLEPGRRYR